MALERFIPKSPDMFIRNSQDFEVAKFGHLNTIVEYINNNTVQPAGLNGYVQFNDNNALGGDAGLFWDNVNKRLGVGTVTPTSLLDVVRYTTAVDNSPQMRILNSADGQFPYTVMQLEHNNRTGVGNQGGCAVVITDGFNGVNRGGLTFDYFNSASYTAAGGSLRLSNDGQGNVYIATNGTDAIRVFKDQGVQIGGIQTSPSTSVARLLIKGSGATSATTSLLVQNSAGSAVLTTKDDLSLVVNDWSSQKITFTSVADNYSQIDFGNTLDTRRSFIRGGRNAQYLFIGFPDFPNIGTSFTPTLVSIGRSKDAPTPLRVNGTPAFSITDEAIVQVNGGLNSTNSGAKLAFLCGDDNSDSPVDSGGILMLKTNTFGSGTNTRMLFYNRQGTTLVERMRISDDGNVGIGLTSPTARLQIKGSGSTGATTGLLIQNSVGTTTFSVNDSGGGTFNNAVTILNGGLNASSSLITTTGNITATGTSCQIGQLQILSTGNAAASGLGISFPEATMVFQGYTLGSTTIGSQFTFRNYNNTTSNLNTISSGLLRITSIGFTSGNANNLSGNTLWIEPTYNFSNASITGTTVRGIYYNPTLTSLTNTTHIGLETVTGNVLLGTTSGNVGVGLTAPTARLQVKGSGATSATTSLLVQNSSSTTTFSVNDAGQLSLPSTAPKITLGGDLTIENTIATRQMVYDVTNGNLSIYSGGVGEGYFIGNRLTTSRSSTTYVTPNSMNDLGSALITAYDSNGNPNITASNNGNRSIVLRGLGANGAVLIGNITTGNGTLYSAILQADSTTQGFLPPRQTQVQRLAIASPAIGLIVYQTDAPEGLYINKSTGWQFIA
jgi:hypothetical protein